MNKSITLDQPKTLSTIADAIPAELSALPQWVCWRYEERKGKPTKIPYNPKSQNKAQSDNRATWGTFGQALSTAHRGYDGIGFVFSPDDEFFGIDLDACRDPANGELTPWASDIIGALESYTEVSPSGYGVKIVARGKMPDGSRNVKKLKSVPTFGDKAPEVAIYDRGRFWCLTGHRLPGAQLTCEPRQEALEGLLAKLFPPKDWETVSQSNGKPSGNGQRGGSWFDRMLSDCAAAQEGERSERDFALCAQAVRHGFTADEIWARVANVGKFAEAGRRYFDATWQRASEAAANDPPKRGRKAKPVIIGEPASLDLRESSGRTDIANGRRFVRRHGEIFRHCAAWRKDLIFDGKRWAIDAERQAEALAKAIADEVWREVGEQLPNLDFSEGQELVRFARSTASAWGIANMLTMARSEPGIAVGPDDLDRDPWALNVENGTLDLQAGVLRPHRREDMLTKLAPVVFDETANCPTWRKFLADIFAGNEKLVRYVQRLSGYCLTGSTREHILPFLYGVGANGKSTFLGTMLELLGTDYSAKAAPELLMLKRGETHPTERADLFGKRFVPAIETQDGRQLAEGLVKELSGGDIVKARKMREDFWSFRPTHKIWLAANHKPIIRGQDVGIWRRVKLIPFTVVFSDERQDKQLPEKLLKEKPGILNWALFGCLDWQAGGMDEPDEVKAATGGYRAAMDVLGQFLGECCILGGEYEAKASDVRARYEEWCKANGEKPVNGRRFGDYLTDKGIEKRKSNGVWYDGIALV